MDPDRTTVSDLLRTFPGAARTLERLRIDVCCGGGRSLAQACAEAGCTPAALLAEMGLAERVVHVGVRAAPAARIAELEADYHARLHVDLPRLRRLVDRVAVAHGANRPAFQELAALFPTVADAIERDLDHAARVQFPAILRGERSSPLADGDTLPQLDHLRALCDGFAAPVDACATWRALYAGLAALDQDVRAFARAISELPALIPAPPASANATRISA